jgi:hypothetical protein
VAQFIAPFLGRDESRPYNSSVDCPSIAAWYELQSAGQDGSGAACPGWTQAEKPVPLLGCNSS